MELVCNFRCFLQTTHQSPAHHVDCYHDHVYKCISQLTVLGRQSFLDECINEASLFRYEVMRQKLVEVLNTISSNIIFDFLLPECFIITRLLFYNVNVCNIMYIQNLEKIRVLRDYRTPRTLMFMTTFFLYLGCLVLAPYFNSYCENDDGNRACSAAYFMAIAYALVLFNIHNVVGDLECSFDHVGVDDIHFCIREHLSRLHHGLPGMQTFHYFIHDAQ